MKSATGVVAMYTLTEQSGSFFGMSLNFDDIGKYNKVLWDTICELVGNNQYIHHITEVKKELIGTKDLPKTENEIKLYKWHNLDPKQHPHIERIYAVTYIVHAYYNEQCPALSITSPNEN